MKTGLLFSTVYSGKDQLINLRHDINYWIMQGLYGQMIWRYME